NFDPIDPGDQMWDFTGTANAEGIPATRLPHTKKFRDRRGIVKWNGEISLRGFLSGSRNQSDKIPICIFLGGETVIPRMPGPNSIAVVPADAAMRPVIEEHLVSDIPLRVGAHQHTSVGRPIGTRVDHEFEIPES